MQKLYKGESMEKKVRFMQYEDDFYEAVNATACKRILYGMGEMAERMYPYLGDIDYVCDKKAEPGSKFYGIPVIRPEDLGHLQGALVILICVKKEKFREEIKELLGRMPIDAEVFDFYNSVSFPVFQEEKRELKRNALKRVRLVCAAQGWIFLKFAEKMQMELVKMGIQADIGRSVDTTADINHYIAYHLYEPIQAYQDTLMITHVDTASKINLLKHQLQTAKMGICMSRETMNQLTMVGIPREKLCYINPAQDGVIKPKKYILGITHRVHEDDRKREAALLDICDGISPDYFEYKIMGDGWDEIVKEVRRKGFTVTYYPEFDYDTYVSLIPSLDYYLFWGFDEGSMGYLDALAAGVKTIVTPQGYHLDTRDGLTYPCRTIPDFIRVLSELEQEKRRIREAVSDWTWENYTKKHVEVWNYILGDDNVYQNKHRYEDGIFSVMGVDA